MHTEPLTIVCWLFKGHGITSGGKQVERDYTAQHVNRIMRLMDRYLTRAHRVVCITDQPHGLACEAIQMPDFLASWPKAFRKLWVFSQEFASLVPGRIFVTDIDVAIVGGLDDLLNRHEQMVAWKDQMQPNTRYSSGNYMFTSGARAYLWDEFHFNKLPVVESWHRLQYGKMTGSDMAWMSYRLGTEAEFGPGIYRARRIGKKLPKNACIVHFSGVLKPWHPKAIQRYPWLKRYL